MLLLLIYIIEFIIFARDKTNLYRLAWVMPKVGAEPPQENFQRMETTVGRLVDRLQICPNPLASGKKYL
jgi:hypothetical protein